MIVHIRATSGGGKTTATRYLLECAKTRPSNYQLESGAKTQVNIGAWKQHPFVCIGPYDKPGTGGCDRIKLVTDVTSAVCQFADDKAREWRPDETDPDKPWIVVFEGLLLAHSWGHMGETLHPKYGRRYHNMFIDTTVERCLANVLQRRLDRGDSNDDPERMAKIEKNVYDDYHRVELAYKRVVARGGWRYDVPFANSGPDIAEHISAWCEAQTLR